MADTDVPYARLIPLAFLNFSIGAGAFFVLGLIGPLTANLSLTKVQAGWIMTAYALGYALTSPILVSLTGRMSRRTVLMIGIGLFIAGSFGSAFAWDATSLYVVRALAAVGAGITTPVVAAVAAGSTTAEKRGTALSIVFAGVTLSQVVGVPAGTFIGFTFGTQVAFMVAAALSAVAALGMLIATPRDVPFAPQSLRTLAKTLGRPRDVVAVALTITITTAGYITMMFMGPLAEMRLSMGRDGVALFLLASGVGAVAGNVLGGVLVDRLGATRSLAIMLAGQVLLAPLFTLVPFGLALGMAISFASAAFGWGFTVPQQARLIALDPAASGVMLSLNSACIYLGSGIGAFIAGVTNESFGLEATGPVSAAIGVLALVHLAVSERLVRHKSHVPGRA